MFEILGYQNVSFTNEKTSEEVNGSKVYLRGESVDPKSGAGNLCLSKFFTSERIKGNLKVGAFCEFIVAFNSNGEPKVIGLKIVS